MLILGLDPGTATTGYGLLEIKKGNFKVIEFGLIETEKDGEVADRLWKIYQSLNKLLKRFNPDILAIERLFFASNAKTAMRVGQAQGVMLLASSRVKAKVFEYAPATVKKSITGDGRADKGKIQKALRKFLGASIRSRPRKKTHFDNAADALAVALCHYLTNFSSKSKEVRT